VEVIIVGRGGGSLEDLWAFNEEIVARAIFNSKIPVVSAVGHHVDYTICDFVADLRAPTPSAAGELVVPDKRELIEHMKNQINSLYYYIEDMIDNKREHIENMLKNYAFNQPAESLLRYRQKIDEYINVMEKNSIHKIELYKQSVESLNKRLHSVNPKSILQRGYCIVEKDKKIVSMSKELKQNDNVKIVFHDKSREAKILDK
jgi:exodeoxyribonuclease VII large subunit